LELAHLNGLEEGFIEWLESCNHFCNSLVDRIVPGIPDEALHQELEKELGYSDQLLTVCEVYRLWAIEGNEQVRRVLSFADADEGVVIETDINVHRELKLRLLNGTHTFSCGLAYHAGCNTVKEAMDDAAISGFIAALMQDEIAHAIPYPLDPALAQAFSKKVLDRFRNPHIRHQWISITMNYSSKMKLRCIPLIQKHYEQSDMVPAYFAMGFAAYLFFMKAVTKKGEHYFGERHGEPYPIQDDQAAVFYRRWTGLTTAALVQETLADSGYWGTELLAFTGFQQAVTDNLNRIMGMGMKEALESLPYNKVVAA